MMCHYCKLQKDDVDTGGMCGQCCYDSLFKGYRWVVTDKGIEKVPNTYSPCKQDEVFTKEEEKKVIDTLFKTTLI